MRMDGSCMCNLSVIPGIAEGENPESMFQQFRRQDGPRVPLSAAPARRRDMRGENSFSATRRVTPQLSHYDVQFVDYPKSQAYAPS
jgi:hypothetical protein